MANIQTVASRMARQLTPTLERDATVTRSSLVAGELRPSKFVAVVGKLRAAVREAFPSDDFAASIAELYLLDTMSPQLIKVYAASFGEDNDTADLILKAYNSEENLAVVQSNSDFAAVIEPFAKQAAKLMQQRKSIVDSLPEAIVPHVYPIAQQASWMHAVDALVKLTEKEDISVEDLDDLLPEGVHIPDSELDNLKDALKAIATVFTADFRAKLAEQFVGLPVESSQKEVYASTGVLAEVISWNDILARAALEPEAAHAAALTGTHAAARLSASATFMLDFSTTFAEGKISATGSCPAGTVGGEIISQLALTEAQQKSGVNNPDGYKFAANKHLACLIQHILAFADVRLHTERKPGACTLAMSMANHLCSLEHHVLYPLFEARLKNLWKIFRPELTDSQQKKGLSFINEVVNLAKPKRNQTWTITHARTTLRDALIEDLDTIINRVQAVMETGSPLDPIQGIQETEAELVHYRQDLVTSFPDQMITVNTSVDHFVDNKTIAAVVTRPVGVIQTPTHIGKGFAEWLLRRDSRHFEAIRASAGNNDVARIYNTVADLSKVNDYNLAQRVTISDTLAHMVNDAGKGVMLERSGSLGAVMASEYFQDANYQPINGDFYVQNVIRSSRHVEFQSGLSSADTKTVTVGNIHGVFGYGEFKGKRDDLMSPFALSLNKALAHILESAFANYGFTPWECKNNAVMDISLEEVNAPYNKRILLVDSEFTESKIDDSVLLTMAASPLISRELQSRIKPEMVYELRHSKYLARTQMLRIVELLAQSFANQLITAHSLDVMKLFRKSLSERLTIADMQTLQQREHRNAVEAASKSLSEVTEGVNDLTFMIFSTCLLDAMSEEIAKKEEE